MVTPDEIEHLNADDKKILAKIEEQIDADLKAQRGHVFQQMYGKWSGGEEVGQRIWAELVRRYTKAGWVVELRSYGNREPEEMVITHPMIDFPRKSYQ